MVESLGSSWVWHGVADSQPCDDSMIGMMERGNLAGFPLIQVGAGNRRCGECSYRARLSHGSSECIRNSQCLGAGTRKSGYNLCLIIHILEICTQKKWLALLILVLALTGCRERAVIALDLTLSDCKRTPDTFTIPAAQAITLNVDTQRLVSRQFVIFKLDIGPAEKFDAGDQENVHWILGSLALARGDR